MSAAVAKLSLGYNECMPSLRADSPAGPAHQRENALVSIIIPTYNRSYCICPAIDSVLTQTHTNVEVIVVDDGSTDGTEALIAERYGADPRVVYHQQTNAGVSAARNAGIALARGEFIGLLDSDDSFMPWKLELQLAAFERHPDIGMVWTDMSAVSPDGHITDARYLRVMYSTWSRFSNETLFPGSEPLADVAPALAQQTGDAHLWFGNIYSPMVHGSLVHTSTVLLRRERLQKVTGFRVDLRYSGEDYDFHLRTCQAGPVGLVDVPTIRYRLGHSDQLTRPSLRVHIAKNYLRTIEPVIAADRENITLSNGELRAIRAEAYEWAGMELLNGGDAVAARPYFRRSLTLRPLSPRTLSWYLLALFHDVGASQVRNAVRHAKRRFRTG